MSSEWRSYELSELCLKITDGAHKSPKSVISGYPMASVKDLTPFGIDISNARHISEQDYKDLVRQGCKPEIGDVLVAKDGSALNVVCNFDKDIDVVLLSSVAIIRPDPKKLDSHFLKHYLNAPAVLEYLKTNFISGAVIPRVILKDFKRASVTMPDINTQKKISDFLDFLDERILLCKENNNLFEAISQALFKSWFVDFDPVRAKMEGRVPEGIDEAIAALFPDSLEESELGLVPKGWKVAHFGDFITRLSVGKKFDQKSASPTGDVPILDQGKSGLIGFHNEVPGVMASLDDPVVVFANHTCYMRLITYCFSAIQNVLPFKGKDVDTVWAFYATKDRIKFSEYKGHWPDFVIEKAVLPDSEVTKSFRKIVDPLVRRMRLNEVEAESIATLRDTLLPRLISGQLRLPEAEELVSQ